MLNIRPNIKSFNFIKIRDLIKCCVYNTKRPSAFKITNKNQLKKINIFFLNENFNQKLNWYRLQDNLKILDVYELILKKIDEDILANLDVLNESKYFKYFLIQDNFSVYLEDGIFVNSMVSLKNNIENGNINTENKNKSDSNTDKHINSKNGNNFFENYFQGFKSAKESAQEIENKIENKIDLIAVDCEMVETDISELELGRITLLDKKGKIILDEIVQPKGKITNYKTEYSGLTKDSFKNSIPFYEAQNKILNFISKETILIGHALFNDLKILKIYHPYLIDTSRLFRTKDNYKICLKSLAKKYLKKEIQKNIHDSYEDCLSTLELFSVRVEYFKRLFESNEFFESDKIILNKKFLGNNENEKFLPDESRENEIYIFFRESNKRIEVAFQ